MAKERKANIQDVYEWASHEVGALRVAKSIWANDSQVSGDSAIKNLVKTVSSKIFGHGPVGSINISPADNTRDMYMSIRQNRVGGAFRVEQHIGHGQTVETFRKLEDVQRSIKQYVKAEAGAPQVTPERQTDMDRLDVLALGFGRPAAKWDTQNNFYSYDRK